MKLSQLERQQRSLTNPARLPLLIVPVKKEDVLVMKDAAALACVLEGVKRSREVLKEAINLASYIYDTES